MDTPWTDGRDLWWHDTVDNASPEHTPEAFDAEHPLFLLYTSGTTGKPKGIMHTSGGFLTQASYTHLLRVRRQTRDRCLLVHRRYRLGDRAHLHRVRPAVQRRHPGRLRGHTGLAERAPAFRGDRKVRRHNLLHGTDADPDVHEMGPRAPRCARPVQPAAAGFGGRADQPGGLAMVSGCASAATEPRSWTRGGRPRQARS